MAKRAILPAAILLATASCGGNVAGGGTGGGGTLTTTATTSSGSMSSSSGTMTTTTATGGSTVTLTMAPFTVPPGGEVYYCQNFKNPFGGQDVDVQTFESHMSSGSHHLLLFYRQGVTADGALTPCSGLEFSATPYGSQQPDDALTYPPGVAALVPGSSGLRLQAHYLNTTGSAIDAHVEVTLHVAAPGTVQNEAGVLFVVNPNFTIQPSTSAVVNDDCKLPQDMNLIGANSHMHRHGTSFTASLAGGQIYETTQWSEPKRAVFDPPRSFHAGDPLHFSCSFTNTGTTPLTFGESAQDNEMCIFTGVFYPAPAGQATIDASQCKATQM